MAKKKSSSTDHVEHFKGPQGYILPGALLLGLGLGVLIDQAGAGVLIGAGAGFLGMFFVHK